MEFVLKRMVEVINRGVILFLFIVLFIFGFLAIFDNKGITGFAVAEPNLVYVLNEGKNKINNDIEAGNVSIRGFNSGSITKRGEIYSINSNLISANNLADINIHEKNNKIKGQIISGIDGNLGVVNGKSYTFNLNENIVFECYENVCLSCVKCRFNN